MYTKTSGGGTLVTPERAKKLDAKRRKAGHILGGPTVAWGWKMYEALQSRYALRNEFIRLFVSMIRLESPFVGDRASRNAGEVISDRSGKVRHTVAPMPFDAYSLGLSMFADKHPYTTVHPMHKKHNDEVMDEYDRFSQAVLDMRMVRGDALSESAAQAIVTGWLPTLHYFDPNLIEQNMFPFDYQVLSPLNVYPLLNHRKQPIVCAIEYEVTGAQLAEDFGMYQGVADLIEAEKTEDYAGAKIEPEHDLYDCKFKVIRIYDDTYTMLIVDPYETHEIALNNNDRLRQMHKAKEDGKYYSLLGPLSEADDNPYCGVEVHNLGGMPVHIEGCWPDPMPIHSLDTRLNSTSNFGSPGYNSIVYYPFLYSMRPTWIDLSRLRSMQHTMVQRATKPEIVAKTDNVAKLLQETKNGIYLLEPDQNTDVKYLQKPDPIDESFKFVINEIKEDLNMGSYGKASYGGRAGQGGRQQEMAEEAGSIRQDMLTRAVQRSMAAYPMGVTNTLISRQEAGDEDVFVAGIGDKYDEGKGYTMEYSVKDLGGVCPLVTVDLMNEQKFKEPADVAAFQSLVQTNKFSDEDLFRMMGFVNPKRLAENAKKEAMAKVKDVFQVEIELEVLKKKNELLEAKWREEKKFELKDDKLSSEAKKELIKQKMKELPVEEQIAKYQADLQEMQLEAQKKLQDKMEPKPQAGATPPDPRMMGMGPGGPPPGPQGPALPPPGAAVGPGAPPMGPGGPPPNVMIAGPGGPPRPPIGGPVGPGGPPSNVMAVGPHPVGPPVSGPLRLAPGMGKGPGQAQQPIQSPSRFSPPGGIGRPGVPGIIRPGTGEPGTPVTLPKSIQQANKGVQSPSIGNVTLSSIKKHKRGKRG